MLFLPICDLETQDLLAGKLTGNELHIGSTECSPNHRVKINLKEILHI